MIGDGGKWWGKRTVGKRASKKKIRMRKCKLVKNATEYISFVLGLASSSGLLLPVCCGVCMEMYPGQDKTLGCLTFVYLCMEKLICQINR